MSTVLFNKCGARHHTYYIGADNPAELKKTLLVTANMADNISISLYYHNGTGCQPQLFPIY